MSICYYSVIVMMLNELITRRDNIMYNLPTFVILTNLQGTSSLLCLLEPKVIIL